MNRAYRTLVGLMGLVSMGPLGACAPSNSAGAGPAPSPRAAAQGAPVTTTATTAGHSRSVTFDEEVGYLRTHGPVEILALAAGGRIAVSPKYQARVMTSAVGPGSASLGFVHRAFIDSEKSGTAFDNFGGEDRFWLGPEGGQFGLYFGPARAYAFDAWQTPHQLQEGTWAVAARDAKSITFERRMRILNRAHTDFLVDVRRTVRILGEGDVSAHLGVSPGSQVAWVAFESDNRVTNAGDAAWKAESGLLSVWVLGMFAPASDANIVIPFDPAGTGPVVNDRYFGAIPADRLKVNDKEGYLVLSADGQKRGKIGLAPSRARGVAGSYSPAQQLLTIVQYDPPKGPAPYVNSMWEEQKDPYAGDVLNAYNDGPTGPGLPSLGGFYELESSSPAAALAPGASLSHAHRTFHFVGRPEGLEPIAKKVLGVSLTALARP